MAENSDEKPKIIVDSDWKEEAQKEKEEADRMTREEAAAELPPPSIAEVIQMILVQASFGLLWGWFVFRRTWQSSLTWYLP